MPELSLPEGSDHETLTEVASIDSTDIICGLVVSVVEHQSGYGGQ